jgi:hypothetical protein
VTRLAALLERLEYNNAQSYQDLLPQQVEKPGRQVKDVPSLTRGAYVAITPMIQERFGYAMSWRNAVGGQTWLSIDEMIAAWDDREILGDLDVCRRHWDGHVLSSHPTSRLSLFGLDREEGDASFLVWPKRGAGEPRVVVYAGQDMIEFENFEQHLEWLLEEK